MSAAPPEPAANNTFQKINATLAPLGTVLGTIAGIVKSLDTIGAHGNGALDTLVSISSYIGVITVGTAITAWVLIYPLRSLWRKLFGPNGLQIAIWTWGAFLFVLNLSAPPLDNPDAGFERIMSVIGFGVIAYALWVWFFQEARKPS